MTLRFCWPRFSNEPSRGTVSAFDFLSAEFPEIYAEAEQAADTALPDPRTSCFYSRRVVEQAVRWPSTPTVHFDGLRRHAQRSAQRLRVQTPDGRHGVPVRRGVVRQGNRAVHEAARVTQRDSITSLSALFQFTTGSPAPTAVATSLPPTSVRPSLPTLPQEGCGGFG